MFKMSNIDYTCIDKFTKFYTPVAANTFPGDRGTVAQVSQSFLALRSSVILMNHV